MTNVVRGSVANSRLYLGLLATFAGVALALAIAGIYGVMAYGVSQRTREFGIRMALGSETARVQRLVVWQGTQLALLGVVLGLPAAYLATKLLSGVLYGVAPGDPLTLVAVAGILATVSVVASYLPSRRVTSVDPILRCGPSSVRGHLTSRAGCAPQDDSRRLELWGDNRKRHSVSLRRVGTTVCLVGEYR